MPVKNPFRKKSKPTPKAPQNVELPPMPEDLAQRSGAVNGLETTLQLLSLGLFQGANAERVQMARNFISAVLENAKKDLESHEQYGTYFRGA